MSSAYVVIFVPCASWEAGVRRGVRVFVVFRVDRALVDGLGWSVLPTFMSTL